MKSVSSNQAAAQRTQSYFEKNFALFASHFVPPQPVVEDYPQNITIRSGAELIRLNINTINSIEAAGDYMCFNCQGGKTHVIRKTMKQLEGELNPEQFIRIHRSNMVNKSKIARVSSDANGEFVVVLTCGQTLKVSRRYKSKVAPQIRALMYN